MTKGKGREEKKEICVHVHDTKHAATSSPHLIPPLSFVFKAINTIFVVTTESCQFFLEEA